MKILFTGGGTGGSVTPLISIMQELKRRHTDASFAWIGTKTGAEHALLSSYEVDFFSIPSGKLHRYITWRNLIDPLKTVIGIFQSMWLIPLIKPDIVVSAGGFVAVPVVLAAWVWRVPVLIHQLDIRPTLSNTLVAWAAARITVTYEQSLEDYGRKAVHTGAPVREDVLNAFKRNPYDVFGLKSTAPVVFIVGGGTGAAKINKLVKDAGELLYKDIQVVHVYGKGRDEGCADIDHPNYHGFEFLKERYPAALAAAHIVVSRAGLASLNELAALGKPTIVIPMPDTHQEDNAEFFAKQDAVLYAHQPDLTPESLVEMLQALLEDPNTAHMMSVNIKKMYREGAERRIADEIELMLGTRNS